MWWAAPARHGGIDDQTRPSGAIPPTPVEQTSSRCGTRHCQAASEVKDVNEQGLNEQLLTFILVKEAFASNLPPSRASFMPFLVYSS